MEPARNLEEASSLQRFEVDDAGLLFFHVGLQLMRAFGGDNLGLAQRKEAVTAATKAGRAALAFMTGFATEELQVRHENRTRHCGTVFTETVSLRCLM